MAELAGLAPFVTAGALIFGGALAFAGALPGAGLPLATAFLGGTGLRAALRVSVRLARALAEVATLAFPEELLLRTGRLADGIFWTLLKN
ncbi:MAG: hypothetical protein ABIX37_09150 [Gammaproteobacteria bacterium]